MHKDKRGYWYRSKRIGSRVVKEYTGRGEWCAALANLDELERRQREDHRRELRSTLESFDTLDREVKAACEVAAAVMAVVLEGAGYHRHDRGAWRKRRGHRPEGNTMSKADEEGNLLALSNKDFQKQIAKAGTDPATAKQIMETFRGTPEEASFIDVLADCSGQAQDKIIARLTSMKLTKLAYERKLELMCQELAGPNPTPLEGLLVQRVLNCWLQVHYAEITLNIQDSPRAVEHCEQRLDKAHKRYLAAIKALAQVRKLQLPTVQVNIGDKQINVAQ